VPRGAEDATHAGERGSGATTRTHRLSDTPVLAFEHVSRHHRLGRERVAVLDDACLEVWPGELVAILGPQRVGKTTLLRVAAGLEAPDAGTVRLAGQALGAPPAGERAPRLRSVGLAPKSWRVVRGKPVLDHVALPLLAEGHRLTTALAKAHAAIERVGAGHCTSASADELAPGDETRVALAQALVRDPRLLLVDEPGALAAPDERDELLRLLRAIAAERPQLAMLVTSRDVAGIAGAGRVLTLAGGTLRGASAPARGEVVPFRARATQA